MGYDPATMLKCVLCETELKNRWHLSRHVKTRHSTEFKEYVTTHEHDGAPPVCACGCGEIPPFKKGRFAKTVPFHSRSMRMKECWSDKEWSARRKESIRIAMNRPETVAKRSASMKKRWREEIEWATRMRVNMKNRWHRNPAWVQKMHELRSSEADRERQSRALKAKWKDPDWSDERRRAISSGDHRAKISSGIKKKWCDIAWAERRREQLRSPERTQKISEAQRRLWASGRRVPRSHWSNVKRGWLTNALDGRDEWYDSGLEREFAKACWERGIRTVRSPARSTVPYVSRDGRRRTYVPDFFLPDLGLVVEIKGRPMPDDAEKALAARAALEEKDAEYVFVFARTKRDVERAARSIVGHRRSAP